jgi:hypothetical protein
LNLEGSIPKEGLFTMEGGGSNVFLDRIKTQEEIAKLLDAAFKDKTKLSLKDFEKFNCEESCEMYLALMVLLQSSLPCSENFTRYKRNFQKYLNVGTKLESLRSEEANNSAATRSHTNSSGCFTSIADSTSLNGNETNNSPNNGEVKQLAAPRLMRSLSPI